MEKVIPGKLDTPEIKAALKVVEDLAEGDRVLKFEQMQASKMNDKPTFDRNASVPPTQLFDNLYFFGNEEVGAFVFDTGEGLLMVDSGFPHMLEPVLLAGMNACGLDPSQVKKMLITHCGPDHKGCAYYFQSNFGTQVYMSKEEFERVCPEEENLRRVEMQKRPDYVYDPFNARQNPDPIRSMVTIVCDGDVVKMGNLEVTCVETPRRVPGGGMSYIANVYDKGEKHVWSTYGNTNVIGNLDDMLVYRKSITHFLDFVQRFGVDVIISNHPFVDDSVRTMEELRGRKEGDAHPFVFGTDKVVKYLEVLDLSSVVIRMRRELGLNEVGCGPYVPGVFDLVNGAVNTTKP